MGIPEWGRVWKRELGYIRGQIQGTSGGKLRVRLFESARVLKNTSAEMVLALPAALDDPVVSSFM